MSRFEAEHIRRFLEAVDKHLKRPVRLVVIGGSAALLQHGARSTTRDIDTFEGDPRLVSAAAQRAADELGFAVPIERATVSDLPVHYETRQELPLPHLKQLLVIVPDRYDLVLSKLLRASQADLVVSAEMHAHRPLSVDVLVARFLEEMHHAIGPQVDRDQNLLAAIEYLWDEETADHAQRRVDEHRARGTDATGRRRKRHTKS